MTSISRDDLSPSQGTNGYSAFKDNLSYPWAMTEDDDVADSEYLQKLLSLTKALRVAKGPRWTQPKMAAHLGTTLYKYKKYETRTPMPHRLLIRFCDTVGVTADDFLSLNVRISKIKQT